MNINIQSLHLPIKLLSKKRFKMAEKDQENQWNIPDGEFCVIGKVSFTYLVLYIESQPHHISNLSTSQRQVYAYPDKADELEAIYTETSRLAKDEPGNIAYCISRDPDDPTVFHFFERYASKEAFAAHNSQPLSQKLINGNLMKDVTAKFMKPIGVAK